MKLFRELLLNLKSLRKSRKVQRNQFSMLQHVPSLGSVKLTSPTCNWTIIPQRLVTKSRFISFLSFPGKWFQSTDHIFRAAAKKKPSFTPPSDCDEISHHPRKNHIQIHFYSRGDLALFLRKHTFLIQILLDFLLPPPRHLLRSSLNLAW